MGTCYSTAVNVMERRKTVKGIDMNGPLGGLDSIREFLFAAEDPFAQFQVPAIIFESRACGTTFKKTNSRHTCELQHLDLFGCFCSHDFPLSSEGGLLYHAILHKKAHPSLQRTGFCLYLLVRAAVPLPIIDGPETLRPILTEGLPC